jgi:hypothetical protein
MVKRALIALACVVVLGIGWVMYELNRYHMENESDMPADIGAAPDFYASDPQLLKPGRTKVRLQMDPSKGDPKGATYFIAFADGSYVWGRTDITEGFTREVYSDQPFKVYWYDDADDQWFQRHPSGRLEDGG